MNIQTLLARRRRRILAKLSDPTVPKRKRSHANGVELPMIDGAIERLRRGEYGLCLDCGGPIEKERLDAIPEIHICRRCEKERRAS
jgi:RNA polymerase-binding transcription factor DksA